MHNIQITIASGKGGTGKTTVAVNLAYSLAAVGTRVTLLDCDVEEPNDHLFLDPHFAQTRTVAAPKPVLDEERCTLCGRCAAACTFNAIAVVKKKLLIFPELCHACGLCTEICPEKALREELHPIGRVRLDGTCPDIPQAPLSFADGTLNVGESRAPTVVYSVKLWSGAATTGSQGEPAGKGSDGRDGVFLIDASPGTACPVVEALRGSDVALLVTEPTPFGLHDLKLAVGLSLGMGMPTGVVINRSVGADSLIDEYCRSVDVPVLGRIPFRREYAETYSKGGLLAREHPIVRELLTEIYQEAQKLKGSMPPPVPEPDSWILSGGEPGPFPPHGNSLYRELGIISGKGGTGKTSVTASLAVLARNQILADADVDAADLHLLLHPVNLEASDFVGGKDYHIDPERCTACGLCEEKCHFHAILHEQIEGVPSKDGKPPPLTVYRIDPVACEGCSLCQHVCPAAAVSSADAVNGTLFRSDAPYGPMVHARLGIGEENSGKLVTEVRTRARTLAQDRGAELVLEDGPPGVGCPVISAVAGLDRVLIVTEPTVSGVHDLRRVLQLAGHFGVPAWVLINKADLNPEQARRIERIAGEQGASIIGSIPFDDGIYEALMAGKPVVEFADGPAARSLRAIWAAMRNELHQELRLDLKPSAPA